MNKKIKGLLVVLVMGMGLWVGWLKYSDFLTKGMRPSVGTLKMGDLESGQLPAMVVETLKGEKIDLARLKGKVVILSFWASWCDPCVAEFPSMIRLVEFFKGEVVMVAVSADHSREDIESFLKPMGVIPEAVKIVWDSEQKWAEIFGTEVLPESYVFSKDLRLVRKVAGAENWFAPGAVELFQNLVSGGGHHQ